MRLLLSSFSLLALIACAFPALAADPDWVLVDENQDSSFFYDRNGTTPARDNTIQVRTRVVYTEQGKKEALKVLHGLAQPSRLYESRYMYQIDCAETEGRLLSVTHFDKKGAILKSSDFGDTTAPEYLPPGSRMALVAEANCSR
ncbi:surface-adhesin E family protein [Geoanaerobacter pelophilus]|uniref:surface-adhesin E family protein n=1 Tax=Geoanaerobacter pelophilus TaxID=60036 RepID=UPI000A271F78|nr:surface-adhesin E family protein [Geoanaerobacter pelophilus]